MQNTESFQNSSQQLNSSFLSSFLDKYFNLFFYVFVASYLIGSGLVYGQFRLFHLVGLLFLPLFLMKLMKNYKTVLKYDLIIMTIVFIWYVISLLWVTDTILAKKYLFYLVNGYYFTFVVCVVVDNLKLFKSTLKVLFFATLANLSVGLIESLTYLRWHISRQSPLNKYFNINSIYDYYYTNLIERIDSSRISYEFMLHQPSGFQWGPNQFGLFLCIFLPFALFCIKRFRYSAIISSCVLYLSFMIASRAVYIAEASVVFFAVIIFFYTNKKKFYFSLGILLIFLAVPFLPLKKMGVNNERAVKVSGFFGAAKNYIIQNTNFNFSLLESYSPEDLRNLDVLEEDQNDKFMDNSVSQRKIMLIKSYGDFLKSPLRGVGLGNSAQDVGLLFGTTQIHNFWLEIFFELGAIFGSIVVLSFLVLFIYICYLLKLAIQKNDEYLKNLLFSFALALVAIVPGVLAVGTGVYQSIVWLLLSFSLVVIRIIPPLLSSRQRN